VGVLCLKDGKPTVVEYSEFPPDLMHLRDEQGGPFLRGHIDFYFFLMLRISCVCMHVRSDVCGAGQLVYNAGNLCIHVFSLAFLLDITRKHLHNRLT
jgi:UDP-N-acetylglucosamine pyrophosphorylase